MRQRRAPLTKRFISGSSSNQPACLGTKRELCSLYVLKTGGGDVAGFCRGSSGFGVDRAVCRDDRDMGPGDPQSVIPNLRSPIWKVETGLSGTAGTQSWSLVAPLGKSLIAVGEGAGCVDSSCWSLHHGG